MTPTAQEILQRILELIPLGAREGGLALDEAAAELEVTPAEILDALSVLQGGMGSLGAGAGDLIQGGIETDEGEGDRIRFFVRGAFGRPSRLLTPEALALALGVRILAGQAGETRRRELLEVARRLEAHLATSRAREAVAGAADRFALDAADGREDNIRARVLAGCRDGSCFRMHYLKPGAREPELRLVEPHHLVQAEGAWYLVAWCRRAGAGRAFRVDRVLELEEEVGPREGPSELDPEEFIDPGSGRVYRATRAASVTIRYSGKVARWIQEREDAEPLPDGGCRIHRQVDDPHWAVAHVLQYGAEAWIESPPELQEMVVATVRRMLV